MNKQRPGEKVLQYLLGHKPKNFGGPNCVFLGTADLILRDGEDVPEEAIQRIALHGDWSDVVTLTVIAAIKQPSLSDGWLAEMWKVFCDKSWSTKQATWSCGANFRFLCGLAIGLFRAVNHLNMPDFREQVEMQLWQIPVRFRLITEIETNFGSELIGALGDEISAWSAQCTRTDGYCSVIQTTIQRYREAVAAEEQPEYNRNYISPFTQLFFRRLCYAELASANDHFDVLSRLYPSTKKPDQDQVM